MAWWGSDGAANRQVSDIASDRRAGGIKAAAVSGVSMELNLLTGRKEQRLRRSTT